MLRLEILWVVRIQLVVAAVIFAAVWLTFFLSPLFSLALVRTLRAFLLAPWQGVVLILSLIINLILLVATLCLRADCVLAVRDLLVLDGQSSILLHLNIKIIVLI